RRRARGRGRRGPDRRADARGQPAGRAARHLGARLRPGDAHRGQEGGRQQVSQPSQGALAKLTPVLSKRWLSPDAWQIDVYERLDGYSALRKALAAHPDDLIQLVKDSGLRGRGGAGFPTGMKWGFIPQNDGKPHYLVVNADEGEPGTCKDLPLMMADPHALIEGIVIGSFAIRANFAAIYVRGEAVHAARRLRAAVAAAYERGYLGKNILGSGFDLDLVVHS